ncbi:alpha/beta hydrolase [Methylosinus sp. H3A]|uniref:alpha/beta hydrolase n=1 Tax=Methylosinus sp. H3A TaxID=2785786 RepID=UPI0018C2D3D0|nr:alpha/beta hydrolase [Methylosinus sp. H3A]MBG0809759.1 alpha/beta hydrolase [Methylosinus sp. H3A]
MALALLKWALLVVVATYFVAAAGLGLFQRRLQYLPDTRNVSPREAGLEGVEELRLATSDGETIVAWHAPPRAGRPVLLYFHGNAGALVDRVARFRNFMAEGYGFLAIAYRGYGGSSGAPTQEGLLHDAEAAYAAARERGYAPARIALVGESLGSGVATQLAARREAAALVLDSPFSSAADVAETRYGFLPVRWIMLDQFRSDLAIRDVRMPVLIVHGDKDGVVPIALGRRLFELANEPKTFVLVPGGQHLVIGLVDVFPRVARWVDVALSTPGRLEASD